MSGKAFFIDTTVCTACRGCQIACKQWNQLPATKTHQWGSMQNPKDLSFDTYKVVRFEEHMGANNKPVWYFFPDQCRHCVEPPCLEAAEDEAPGGIVVDKETGAVIYHKEKLKKIKPETVIEACPFNIPRAQEKTGFLAKCNMCIDRVHNGLLPACVKTCPTGAMNFGDRDKMVELAQKRLAEVKGKYPKATLTGIEDLRVFYLLADEPAKYHTYAKVDPLPGGMDRKMALRKIGSSLKELSSEWTMIHKLAS